VRSPLVQEPLELADVVAHQPSTKEPAWVRDRRGQLLEHGGEGGRKGRVGGQCSRLDEQLLRLDDDAGVCPGDDGAGHRRRGRGGRGRLGGQDRGENEQQERHEQGYGRAKTRSSSTRLCAEAQRASRHPPATLRGRNCHFVPFDGVKRQLRDECYRRPMAERSDRAGGVATLDRSSIASSLDATRPWSGLVRRHLAADAVRVGVAVSGLAIQRTAALAVIDGREPDVTLAPAAAAAARGWADALELLQVLSVSETAVAVDEGVLRTVHWVLHRRAPALRPGHVRAGVVLAPPAPPRRLDPFDAAVWVGDRLRTVAPFWAENASVAHAVETLLLARADGVPVVAAGRPTTAGKARDVLAASAEAHRRRLAEAEQRWFTLGRELSGRGLPDRMTGPCWDAVGGAVLTNAGYRKAVEAVRGRTLSEQQATRDLNALVAATLLRATGRTRDRAYRWNR
jgi:hypothetical protein